MQQVSGAGWWKRRPQSEVLARATCLAWPLSSRKANLLPAANVNFITAGRHADNVNKIMCKTINRDGEHNCSQFSRKVAVHFSDWFRVHFHDKERSYKNFPSFTTLKRLKVAPRTMEINILVTESGYQAKTNFPPFALLLAVLLFFEMLIHSGPQTARGEKWLFNENYYFRWDLSFLYSQGKRVCVRIFENFFFFFQPKCCEGRQNKREGKRRRPRLV